MFFYKLVFFEIIFLYQKFFLKFFEKIFFALNCFLGWFMAKKIFLKKFQKKFWPKKIRNFFQNLICEKVPSFSQKMMIYHKMPMSGVYENVFQTSEISILPSLSNELLFTLCLCTPSNFDPLHTESLNYTYLNYANNQTSAKVDFHYISMWVHYGY